MPLKFLPICEGNRVAAVILDYVYTFATIFDRVETDEPFRETVEIYAPPWYDYYYNSEPFATILHYDEVNWEGHLAYESFDVFRSKLATIAVEAQYATNVQLVEALELLWDKKRFISLTSYTPDWVEYETFELCCPSYCRKTIDGALFRLQEVVQVEPPPPPLFDRGRERRIVASQNARAGRNGQPAILTLDEWIETLEYYQGRCAFNPAHPYEVLEHFYPLSGPTNGAGTSAFNCIPACARCNVMKGDRLPENITSGALKEAIPAIQVYLATRKEQWMKSVR